MIVDYDNPDNNPFMPYRCPICFNPVSPWLYSEERAEESYIKYRNSKCKIIRNSKNNHLHKDWRESGVDRHKAYTDGYLDGLAEGRKEKMALSQIKNDREKVIEYNERLENKLNESNEMCNMQALRITELEAQIEKFKKLIKNCTQFYGDDTELYSIWKGLKMEIEK